MDRCPRSSTVRSQAILIVILAFLVSVTLPTLAFSAIRYVADNGTDTPGCGLTVKTACRSITQAMALAVAGDTVIVAWGVTEISMKTAFMANRARKPVARALSTSTSR